MSPNPDLNPNAKRNRNPDQLVADPGIVERGDDRGQAFGLGLQELVLVDYLPRRLLVVPEVSPTHLLLEFVAATDLAVVVKESRGWSRSAPRDR